MCLLFIAIKDFNKIFFFKIEVVLGKFKIKLLRKKQKFQSFLLSTVSLSSFINSLRAFC